MKQCQAICKTKTSSQSEACKLQLLEKLLNECAVDDLNCFASKNVNSKMVINELMLDNVVHAMDVLLEIIQEFRCDKNVINTYFDILVDKIAWFVKHWCMFRLLIKIINNFRWCFEGTYKSSVLTRNFVKRVLNHPKVVESFVNASIVPVNRFARYTIMEKIGELFTDESALEILRKTRKKKVFYIFGYHPVISKHVKLQCKWLQYFVKEKIYSLTGLENITIDALETVPLNSAMRFICRVFVYGDPMFSLQNVIHFDLAKIKKIIMIHMVAYGKTEENKLCLEKIEYTWKPLFEASNA